jgi:hypothetical protein
MQGGEPTGVGPERQLRAIKRLHNQTRCRIDVDRQSGDAGGRTRRNSHRLVCLSTPVDRAAILHGASPAHARPTHPAGDLPARQSQMPVLRSPFVRADGGSRHSPASRRPAHLGEPGDCLSILQPAQRRQNTPGSWNAAPQHTERASRVACVYFWSPAGRAYRVAGLPEGMVIPQGI